jgi:hypothetical protein
MARKTNKTFWSIPATFDLCQLLFYISRAQLFCLKAKMSPRVLVFVLFLSISIVATEARPVDLPSVCNTTYAISLNITVKYVLDHRLASCSPWALFVPPLRLFVRLWRCHRAVAFWCFVHLGIVTLLSHSAQTTHACFLYRIFCGALAHSDSICPRSAARHCGSRVSRASPRV